MAEWPGWGLVWLVERGWRDRRAWFAEPGWRERRAWFAAWVGVAARRVLRWPDVRRSLLLPMHRMPELVHRFAL